MPIPSSPGTLLCIVGAPLGILETADVICMWCIYVTVTVSLSSITPHRVFLFTSAHSVALSVGTLQGTWHSSHCWNGVLSSWCRDWQKGYIFLSPTSLIPAPALRCWLRSHNPCVPQLSVTLGESSRNAQAPSSPYPTAWLTTQESPWDSGLACALAAASPAPWRVGQRGPLPTSPASSSPRPTSHPTSWFRVSCDLIHAERKKGVQASVLFGYWLLCFLPSHQRRPAGLVRVSGAWVTRNQ